MHYSFVSHLPTLGVNDKASQFSALETWLAAEQAIEQTYIFNKKKKKNERKKLSHK
jgi:hypothetical protein